MPIFCRKNIHSLRNTVLLCQLKKNHEKPPAVMPIFDQKTSILSKQHYIMSQRSQQDALFFRFLTKKLSLLCPYFVKKRPFSKKHTLLSCLMPIVCKKKVNSLKITILSCPYFLKKTSILSKKLCYYVVFFKFFMKNPMLSYPHLVKNVNSVKIIVYYGPNSMPFFPQIFTKITALMPIFVKKMSVHEKKR